MEQSNDSESTNPMPLSLQENVLTLLCFSDEAAGVISGIVDPALFDKVVYRKIANQAIDYYRMYKKAPGIHIADLLDDERKKQKHGKLIEHALNDIKDLYDQGVNEQFVLTNLKNFIHKQKMKIAIVQSAKEVEKDVEKAEQIFLKAIKEREHTFEPGVDFRSTNLPSYVNSSIDEDHVYFTGIDVLDKMNIGLARQSMFMFMAPTNRGKTWAAIHFGRYCMRQRLKVLHITLETPEKGIVKRYAQALYSMVKKSKSGNSYEEINQTFVKRGKKDLTFDGYEHRVLERPVLYSSEGKQFFGKKWQKDKKRLKLVVKKFPAGTLSIHQLEAYMDMLERYNRFVPDVLILDYPDLMDIDSKMLREDTGRMYTQLHGLIDERNIALIVPVQSNRGGEQAGVITLEHMAEDYRKAHIADTVITYNQTRLEKEKGLCRLFVAKEREEKSGMIILQSQSYETGQFHISSALLDDQKAYFRMLNADE